MPAFLKLWMSSAILESNAYNSFQLFQINAKTFGSITIPVHFSHTANYKPSASSSSLLDIRKEKLEPTSATSSKAKSTTAIASKATSKASKLTTAIASKATSKASKLTTAVSRLLPKTSKPTGKISASTASVIPTATVKGTLMTTAKRVSPTPSPVASVADQCFWYWWCWWCWWSSMYQICSLNYWSFYLWNFWYSWYM
ncbi:unnamed protein product [Brugia pahangi]|uniref:Uncharacterized protein n=1 Tax=Brugia pahangi TaxID=6280 RepID=A0A0N4T9X2_BRUPA|nr:unnamed protein product [Brugia pahangi]